MSESEQRFRGLGIAREGLPFILAPLVLGAMALALSWVVLGAVLLAIGLFCLAFFRDPDRVIPDDSALLVSPADGTVTAVEESPSGLRISIFLSIFDVHVNRSPVAGRVQRVKYHPGRFIAANFDKSSTENERNTLILDTERGEIRVVQIAGVIARRIICRVQPGDTLGSGERFGMIRFGSRTDLIVPPGAEPLVRIGTKVRGGSSVVARWSDDRAGLPGVPG